MSFEVFKARRTTEFWKEPNSGQKVGPGSYNLNKVPFSSRKANGYAPFCSMTERFGSTNNTSGKTLMAIPIETSMLSPGSNPQDNFEVHQQQLLSTTKMSRSQSVIQKPPKQSSSFMSKKPRLAAPMAMLGTEFQSTQVENPGPGTYTDINAEWTKTNKLEQIKEIFKEQAIMKKQRIQQAIQEIEGENKKKRKQKPTIPSRKPHKNGYSGIDQDTPGPSGYDPKTDLVKSKTSASLFSKSKVDREVFQINETLPGPSDYDKKTQPTDKKDFCKNSAGAIFGSKVPNCKDRKIDNADLPGPGAYEPFKDPLNISTDKISGIDKSRLNDNISSKNANYLQNALNKCPFIDVYDKEQNPGPGNYFQQDPKEKILQRLKNQHFEAIQKPKPGFNSHLERDCNKNLERIDKLGPGVYIDINNPINSSLNKTLLKFQSDRNYQETYGVEKKPFGSSTSRFHLNKKDQERQIEQDMKDFQLASDLSYKNDQQHVEQKEKQTTKYNKIRESKSQGSFQFKSKGKRLQFQDQTDPNVITINTDPDAQNRISQIQQYQQQTGALMIACANKSNQAQRQNVRPNQLTQRFSLNRIVSFESSQERFGFNKIAKQTLEQVPGPGSYDLNTNATTRPDTKKRSSRNNSKTGFNTSEKKFNPKFSSYIIKQSSNALGPGQYHKKENLTMVKKSYNMAIEGSQFQ
ncbi:UNKNOWN [Stylonychia lemnae]|uniref:Uncharacterized protein n=1 Tax=Stylonychia lemnae TaxID=5949 RepID=A0A077ZWU5_STYLE|nr:UNKNOWN [Stylonychia lemnae]|eukprot:CDW74304.1 UNKNOWN [Stylonychia lemnae]